MRVASWGLGIFALAVLTTGCATFFEVQVDSHRFTRALTLQRQGKQTQALTLYRTLASRDRRYPGVLNNIAVIYARQGRLARAEERLAEAARIGDDEAVIWSNLGIVRFMLRRHAAARRALEEVVLAGRRRLSRVAGKGRANFAYGPVRRSVDRTIAKAESYLKLLARRTEGSLGSMRRAQPSASPGIQSVKKPDWIQGPLTLLHVRTTTP